jgi:hypothetical protein
MVTGAGGGEPVAARGVGEEVGVAARGAGGLSVGDGAAHGVGEEVVGGATDAQPGDGPAGNSLCGDPIGASTVSDASRNSRVAGVEGPSRSAKGKAVSSKMTCLEMIIWLEDMSRQRYPLW